MHFAASNTNMSVSDNTFNGSYSNIGGGVYLYASNQNITFSSLFTNCHAQSNGGGMYIDNANYNLSLVRSTFISNSADSDGGGLYISYGNSYLFVVASPFLQNIAGRQGGGVMIYNENYLLNFLDLSAFLHHRVIKQTELTNVPYSKVFSHFCNSIVFLLYFVFVHEIFYCALFRTILRLRALNKSSSHLIARVTFPLI